MQAQKLRHYDLPSLAKSLKLASIDVIKTRNMDIESHWFRSSGPADLYYWKAKDRIVKHQISIFNHIDGGKAEVICFDQKVNETVVRQAILFLKDVRQVDEKVTLQLIANYQFYNRWHFKLAKNPVFRFFKKVFSVK